jgi:hypothetical protein
MCGKKKRKPLIEPEVQADPGAKDYDGQVFYWRQVSKRYVYHAKRLLRAARLSPWRFFSTSWTDEYLRMSKTHRRLAKTARVCAAAWEDVVRRDMEIRAIESTLPRGPEH